jgi:L-ascorbate metabolism protein UlaG (beta-lactamase superfamily)
VVLQYVGHGTVLVSMDGVRLLTDPLLRKRVVHLRRAVPLDPEAVRDLDAVLISHAHYDHLDVGSLRRLRKTPLAVIPKGLELVLRTAGLGFGRVVGIVEGDEIDVGGVRVVATHADHEGDRPFPRVVATAVGYAILGSKRVYFAGDTDVFPEMDGLVPELDLALVPIWGWGPTLGRGKHMDPERAADAVALLRPRVAVPIHWGSYHPIHIGLRRPPAYLREPPQAFVEAVRERAPDVDVRVLQPGERLTLDGEPQA